MVPWLTVINVSKTCLTGLIDEYNEVMLLLNVLFSFLVFQTSEVPNNNNNNSVLYLHDHKNTHSIAKAMFRNPNYNAGHSITLLW